MQLHSILTCFFKGGQPCKGRTIKPFLLQTKTISWLGKSNNNIICFGAIVHSKVKRLAASERLGDLWRERNTEKTTQLNGFSSALGCFICGSTRRHRMLCKKAQRERCAINVEGDGREFGCFPKPPHHQRRDPQAAPAASLHVQQAVR